MAALACAAAGMAHADVNQADEYMKRLKVYQTVQPAGETPFGEQVNLYTGELTFRQADISLEGIGPIPQSLVRSLLTDAGLSVLPLGIEEVVRSVTELDANSYAKLDLPSQLRPPISS